MAGAASRRHRRWSARPSDRRRSDCHTRGG
jgi:hypothetical protein